MSKYLGFAALTVVALAACKRAAPAALKDEASDATAAASGAAGYAAMCAAAGVPLPPPLADKFWGPGKRDTPGAQHFGGSSGSSDLFLGGSAESGCAFIVRNDTTAIGDGGGSASPADTVGGIGDLDTQASPGETAQTAIPDLPGESVVASASPSTSSAPVDRTLSICWSAAGSVCFWADDKAPVGLTAANGTYKITDAPEAHATFQNGETRQACTECHRGDNALIGHGPNGKTDPNFAEMPQGKFTKAIVPAAWPQNAPGTEATQCAAGCHSIPQLNAGYCFMATRMVSYGLMRGAEYGFGGGTTTPSAEDCAPYVQFLKECDVANGGGKFAFYATKENAGKCAAFLSK